MKKIQLIILTIFLFFPNNVYSLIEVDITRGNLNPLPIAVSPLYSDEKTIENGKKELKLDDIGSEISNIIENNLLRSGIFKPLDNLTAHSPNALSDISKMLNL